MDHQIGSADAPSRVRGFFTSFRSGGQFWLSLALSVVLSVGTSFAVTNWGFSYRNNTVNVDSQSAGGALMTSTELLSHLQGNVHAGAYWFGPVTDARYTEMGTLGDVQTVFYWRPGAVINRPGLPVSVVRSYSNFAVYSANVHPLTAVSTERQFQLDGRIASYSTNTMDYVTVTFSTKPDIVEIHFPEYQTEASLLNYASELLLINANPV